MKRQGNDRAYIAARLKRDHPEIAKAFERGEFTSLRQAGIAAGFVKVQPNPWDDPVALAGRIIRQGEDFGREVMEELKAVYREEPEDDPPPF